LESDGRDDLTSLLEGARSGQSGAQNRLFEAVYKHLHGLAVGLMQGERTDHTLQPSALVNEAVLRLVQSQAIDRVEDRRCLFVVAAQTMRQVLVDHARNRGAAKRLGDRKRVPLDDVLAYFEEQHIDVLALQEAIEHLMGLDQRTGLVVVLKFFGGLTTTETAEVLDVSPGTVERDWRIARAWLRGHLGEDSG